MADLPTEIELHISGQVIPLRIVRGREAISETYRFELAAFPAEGIEVDPATAVKSQISLVFSRDGERRRIDGLATEVFVDQRVSARPELRVVMEPRFAITRFRTNIKIFRDKAAPDIIAEVLAELGVQFELRLQASYPDRPYTVQHRETDFAFVSRMMEEEGMFYYFLPGDVMVIGDSKSAYETLTTVPFRQSALNQNEERVWEVGELAEAGVSEVALRDWSIDQPSLPMDVAATGPTASGPEWYDYPGEYDNPGAGQRIAHLIAESYQCQAQGIAGRSTLSAQAPGWVITIVDSPAGAVDGSFVTTVVEHDFNREHEGFAVTFEGLDANITFRPPRIHEEPILAGPVTGIVTGPAGSDIHCDSLGRVKVHFHWDRLLPYDDDCSHWVPVLQDNTGHSVAIPRVGWEVLVHFLEGDPDRPVVLGRVYNAADTFPITLPGHKTWTALRSLSSPTRDGTNEIQFEDRAGDQRIQVRAERDQNVIIANDKSEHVMVSEVRHIERDETIDIGNDQVQQVGGNLIPTVGGDQQLQVGGDLKRNTGQGEGVSVDGNYALSIGGLHNRFIAYSDTTHATNISETIGGVNLEVSQNANTLGAGKAMTVTVGGAIIELAKGNKLDSAAKARAEQIGGVVFAKADGEMKINVDDKRFTTVGGALKVTAEEQISLTGVETMSMRSLLQAHEAGVSVTLEVGDTKLTMKEEVIQFETATIVINVTGENNLGAEESYQN